MAQWGHEPTCGLQVDMQPDDPAPIEGDWIATEAGSRYLVVGSRLVRSRRHAQTKRYALRCERLEKNAEPPEDVRVVWLTWYRRSGGKARV